MRALIIEDKEYIRKGLIGLLQMLKTDIEVVGECESVKEALVVTGSCRPDLIFLDINLTDGTAFDFLEQVENITFKVIFITAHEEYALKALKEGAIDYLLKPLDLEELEIALLKLERTSIATQEQQINTVRSIYKKDVPKMIISLHDSFQVIDLEELLYCESDKGYTTFHCSDGKKHVVSKTLKEFEQRLSKVNFVRVHQSYIVNLAFIDKYDKSGVIHLKSGKRIPVSSRKKGAFLTILLQWDRAQ